MSETTETPEVNPDAEGTPEKVTSPAAKAATKAKAKPKAKAKAKAKPKVAPSGDVVKQAAEAIETVSAEDALAQVDKINEDNEFNSYRLGGLLNRIQSEGWYKEEGYSSFRTYLMDRVGLHYRKADYLIKNYNFLTNAGITFDQVSKVGWSKLKEIASLLTKDNVDDWVAKALELNLIQLVAYVRAYKAEDGDDKKASMAADVVNRSFKLHPDQDEIVLAALELAKSAASTEYDTVALTAICETYCSGDTTPQKSLKAMIKGTEWKQVLELFCEVYPAIDIEVTEPGAIEA